MILTAGILQKDAIHCFFNELAGLIRDKRTKTMKSSMSGQNIPLIHRLISFWGILRAYKSGTFGNVDSIIKFHYELSGIFNKYVNAEVEGAGKILEIGCGRTATQTALFKADGKDIVGIDMEIATYKMNFWDFIQVIRCNGVERAIKSLVRHLFFDKKYFSELSLKYSKPVSFENLDVRLMSATSLTFPDNYFDFVYSAWTFEHVDGVPAAIKEVNRVLKKSGIAYIAIHLFPSLSGGHHTDWICPDKSSSTKAPPWDHCLNNQYPVNTYLNKLCLRHYREIFKEHINVINEKITGEGEKYLSSELEEKLYEKGYTREDLLTRTVTFLCQKE